MAAEAATADLRKPRRLVSIWVILRILHSDWEHNRRGGFSRSLLVGDTAILLLRPPFGYIPRYGPCTYQSMQGLPFPFPKPLKTRPLRRKASCGRHVEGGFPQGTAPSAPPHPPRSKSPANIRRSPSAPITITLLQTFLIDQPKTPYPGMHEIHTLVGRKRRRACI